MAGLARGFSGAPLAVIPPLPMTWVQEGIWHGQGEMYTAGNMLAGNWLAHLLCRSLMTRLSSPSPAMAVHRDLQRQGQ